MMVNNMVQTLTGKSSDKSNMPKSLTTKFWKYCGFVMRSWVLWHVYMHVSQLLAWSVILWERETGNSHNTFAVIKKSSQVVGHSFHQSVLSSVRWRDNMQAITSTRGPLGLRVVWSYQGQNYTHKIIKQCNAKNFLSVGKTLMNR